MHIKRAAVWLLAGMTFLALGASCFSINDLNPETRDCPNRQAWYPDADGDGAGDPSELWVTCGHPDGFVDVAGDCDDRDPEIQACPDSGDTGADSGDTGADSGDSGTDSGDTGADSGDSGTDSGDTSVDSDETGAVVALHSSLLSSLLSRLFQVLSR